MIKLGQELRAICDCGYSEKALCGSTRRQYGHVFNYPHRCKSCDQVVTIDVLSSSYLCPKCGSHDVVAYGKSLPCMPRGTFFTRLIRIFNPKAARDYNEEYSALLRNIVGQGFCSATNTMYGMPDQNQLCPSCKMVTLRFGIATLYD